jgi:hypothetical protein
MRRIEQEKQLKQRGEERNEQQRGSLSEVSAPREGGELTVAMDTGTLGLSPHNEVSKDSPST